MIFVSMTCSGDMNPFVSLFNDKMATTGNDLDQNVYCWYKYFESISEAMT